MSWLPERPAFPHFQLPWWSDQLFPLPTMDGKRVYALPQEQTEIPPNPVLSSWTAPLPMSVTTALLSPICRYHITMTTENYPTCLVISPVLA